MTAALAACGGQSQPSAGGGEPAGAAAGNSEPASTQNSPSESDGAPVDITVNFDNISLSGVDPQLSTSTNITHLDMLFNGLFRINEDTLVPEPDLAESYEISDDGLTYTVKLKRGVQFHRGYGEMTSEDVAFSIMRAVTHENSQYKPWFNVIDDVRAVDGYTVDIVLNQIYPDLPYILSDELGGGLITSKKAHDELGDEGFAETPVGTGPFIFDEAGWIPQQESVFKANPDYFGEKVAVNVRLTEVKDGSTVLLAYQNGEIDFFLSSQLEIVTQAEQAGAVVDFQPAPIAYGLMFNGDFYPPFKDPKVREALFYAIDRDTNRVAVFGDKMARKAVGVIPDNMPGYTMEGIKEYEYDPELSKQLLQEAGYENALEFTAIIQNNPRNERLFTLIQQQFADVGIKMDIQAVSTSEYYAAEEERRVACSYSSVTGLPNLYFNMVQNYLSGALRNYTDYSGVDDLIEAASKIPEGPERNEIYAEVQRRFSEDRPYFLHHFVNVILVHSPELAGVYSKGANGGDVRFEKAYIMAD
jgi:peptide/nickel transport system substrate-binding protein